MQGFRTAIIKKRMEECKAMSVARIRGYIAAPDRFRRQCSAQKSKFYIASPPLGSGMKAAE